MNTTKPINLLIEEFLSEVDCKPNTIATYRRTLSIWVNWMVQNARITDPTRADIIRYKNYLMSTRQITTTDNYIASVKLFFIWLNSRNIHENVAQGIHRSRKYQGHRKGYLKPEQVSEILLKMTKALPILINRRNYAIVNLMVRTGLRCSEVVSLNIGDLMERGTGHALRIQRKGRNEKDASLIIPDSVTDPIIEYIYYRDMFNDNDPLFASHGQRPNMRITTQTISNIVMDALELIGIKDKKITAHSLRHTAAVNALRGGAALYDVQQMLGHHDPNTTMIYLRELEHDNLEATYAIKTLDKVYQIEEKPIKKEDYSLCPVN